jgi:hypothetical protein
MTREVCLRDRVDPSTIAVVASVTSSQHEAVGAVAAIHTFTNFSDLRRCVSLRRFTSPHADSRQPRTRSSQRSRTGRSVRPRARRERRRSLTITVTIGNCCDPRIC